MRVDPNELHVAIENKSINVGGFSTEEQLYEFCGGMMLPHSFLLLMCLFNPFLKGTSDSSFRVRVKMSFSVYTRHGDLTGKPHSDKKRHSLRFILLIL